MFSPGFGGAFSCKLVASFEAVPMFRALVLQVHYTLVDEQTECKLRDRPGFMRFADLRCMMPFLTPRRFGSIASG